MKPKEAAVPGAGFIGFYSFIGVYRGLQGFIGFIELRVLGGFPWCWLRVLGRTKVGFRA